jgi:hypothetical protein
VKVKRNTFGTSNCSPVKAGPLDTRRFHSAELPHFLRDYAAHAQANAPRRNKATATCCCEHLLTPLADMAVPAVLPVPVLPLPLPVLEALLL